MYYSFYVYAKQDLEKHGSHQPKAVFGNGHRAYNFAYKLSRECDVCVYKVNPVEFNIENLTGILGMSVISKGSYKPELDDSIVIDVKPVYTSSNDNIIKIKDFEKPHNDMIQTDRNGSSFSYASQSVDKVNEQNYKFNGDNMTGKHFKKLSFNQTEQIKQGGLFGRLTGRNDLIYLRNKYQTEIDNSWAALMNMAHYLETNNDTIQTIVLYNDLVATLGQVKDMERKARISYDKIFNCIKLDQDYSERMWKIHQEMYKVTSSGTVNVSTSFENINVSHEAVRKYVERYPRVEIRNDVNEIKNIENEIVAKKNSFRKNKALLRDYFEQFKLELIKCESKLDAYNKVLNEGKLKITECRFKNSFLYSLMTAEDKAALEIDTLKHRIDQVERTIVHYKSIKANIETNKYDVKLENLNVELEGEFKLSNSEDII